MSLGSVSPEDADCWDNLKRRLSFGGETTANEAANQTRQNVTDNMQDGADMIKGMGIPKFTGWGFNNEPEHEIVEITEVPADFMIGNEVLAEDECYRITLKITQANDLFPMDSNGMSDPYCEINLHRDLQLKTKTISKSLNPVWNETFSLYIDDRSALANLVVYDYDLLGSNDRIGYLDLDLASIPPFHRYTTTLPLSSSVDGEENVGTISFSYLVEIVKTEFANDIRSIGTKGQERLLGIIQLTVIEGIDLPPMNSDGTCDPYIRLQLGSQQHETKVVQSTLNPKWRETFEFRYLSTTGDTIQASLWDNEVGLSDNIIGDTEIDVTKIAPNKPFKYIFSLDNTNTKISFLIKILKFAELGATELQLSKEINDAESRVLTEAYSLAKTGQDIDNVGYLIVKLIRATNIPPKQFGTVDPFVVFEIENCRSVSPVRESNLEPEWNLTYRFPINDYHSVLYISLWDEEELVSNVQLGKIAIPLFNCKGLKKYILKDEHLKGVGKGELIVETTVFYNPIRAAIRTFTPKEEIIMKEQDKFEISLLQRDVKRITAQVEIAQDVMEGIDNIIRWRSKPLSLFSMIFFVFAVYYVEIWMLPLLGGCALLWSWLYMRYGRGKFETYVEGVANVPYYLRTGRGEGDGNLDEANMSITERFNYMYDLAATGQATLDLVASLSEKIKNIGQWKNPYASCLLMILLCVASIALYFIPIRYILLGWGINKFRKFGMDPNLIDNFEVEDFLSRIPSDPQLQELKEPSRIRRRTG